MYRVLSAIGIFCLFAVFFSASSQAQTADCEIDDIIFVGAKQFPEGETLSWIVYHMLRHEGYLVQEMIPTGDTFTTRAAITGQPVEDTDVSPANEIDTYVEYTATGLGTIIPAEFPEVNIRPEAVFDPLSSISSLNNIDPPRTGIMWLTPALANNTYGIAISTELSVTTGIRTMDDFATYVNASPANTITLAGEDEFFGRDTAWPAFVEKYQINEDHIIELDVEEERDIDVAGPFDTVQEIIDGNAEAAMIYGTSAVLLIEDVVSLKDTQRAQPLYLPVPVFRQSVVANCPNIPVILQPVFEAITGAELQEMNLSVSRFGNSSSDAAMNFLQRNDFIPATTPTCTVSRPTNSQVEANLRNRPSLEASVVTDSLAPGGTLTADGVYTRNGIRWYRLEIGAWVYGEDDVVIPAPDCSDLLPVTP
jgi:osmoprotectant transport system substrate-binding protein